MAFGKSLHQEIKIVDKVDWSSYASVYDMILAFNPAYKELLRTFSRDTATWQIEPGALLADFGAGTGNFSLQLARQFPRATVLHIDQNQEMNDLARTKAERERIGNMDIITKAMESIELENESLAGFSCVHALYASSEPKKMLTKMYDLLRPGGCGVICDLGRVGSLLSWSVFLMSCLIREKGVLQAVDILRKSGEVLKQNRAIRRQQINGIYWTHEHHEFLELIMNAGFAIERCEICYRGNSDYIVFRK